MKKGKLFEKMILFLGGSASLYILNRLVYGHNKLQNEDKNRKYVQILDNWLVLCECGKKIEEYFDRKGINEIAVYGCSYIGRHLITQLMNTDIKVKYIIDRRTMDINYEIDQYHPSDSLPEVKMIVVTPVYEYQEIKKALSDKVSCKIISIEDIIYELL